MERKADADLGQETHPQSGESATPPRPTTPEGAGRDQHPVARAPGWWGGRYHWLQVTVLVLLAAGGVGLALTLQPTAPPDSLAQYPPSSPAQPFQGWERPEVVLVLSGQEYGYLQPCGCSEPQYGGLARRFNFLQGLKDKGWPVVAVDLGDIVQRDASQRDTFQRSTPYRQKMDKYRTSMESLQKMGYTAVSLGQQEMALGTLEVLSYYALNSSAPRVLAANLLNRGPNELFLNMVGAWAIADKKGGPRVAVFGLIGPSVGDKVNGKDKDVKLHPKTSQVIYETLNEIKQDELTKGKVALTTLLYQGSLDEAKKCAKFCADLRKDNPTLPRLDVILCLTVEDIAPSDIAPAGESIIVRVGHKGKSVGVVGAFRKGQGRELRYQMIELSPKYDTPKGQEASNPVMAVMEEYARRVKASNYLAEYRQVAHPVQLTFEQASYVGSDKCRACHKEAYNVWKKSKHAHAYASLVDAKRPSLRQFDGECVSCHTVGFGYNTGFMDEVKTAHLKDVGCESCHGPASEHVKNPNNEKLWAVLNPWKAKPNETEQGKRFRQLQIDLFCQKCHDENNDVHWKFEKNWPQIVHTIDGGNAAVAPPPAPAIQPIPNIPAIPPAVQQPLPEARPTSRPRFFRRDN